MTLQEMYEEVLGEFVGQTMIPAVPVMNFFLLMANREEEKDRLIAELSEKLKKERGESCLKIAKGCHDYNGGHHDKRDYEIYHHGIQTVINALDAYMKKGLADSQVNFLHSIGGEA